MTKIFFKTGKRLVTKIFNASRFVQMQLEDIPFKNLEDSLKEIIAPIDQAWVKALLHTKIQTVDCLRNYNHAGALELIEKSFWAFCDNYLELVKARVYQLKGQKEGLSGKRALDYSLYTFLKLFAPYLPYVTEELWSGRYKKESSSVHSSLWLDRDHLEHIKKLDLMILKYFEPSFGEITNVSGKLLSEKANMNKQFLLENAFAILEQIRGKKSDLNKSLASPLKSLEIQALSDHLQGFELYKGDIARAAHVRLENIFTVEQADLKTPSVKIQLDV